MHIDIDKILEDTCYKLPKGYPTIVNGVFTEREEVLIINEVLEAKGLPTLPLPEAKPVKDYQAAANFITSKLTQKVLGSDLDKITLRPFITKDNEIRLEAPQASRMSVASKLALATKGGLIGNKAEFNFNLNGIKYTCTVKPTVLETKTDTDVKEGLSVVLANINDPGELTKDNVRQFAKKILQQPLSKAVEGLDNKVTKKIRNYLNVVINATDNSTLVKAAGNINQNISHSNSFQTFLNKNPDFQIERSTFFESIRKLGSDIAEVEKDKWCPGDIYFIRRGSEGFIEEKMTKAEEAFAEDDGNPERAIGLLNGLFSDISNFDQKVARKHMIVAVSLKMQDAQGGKLKSALAEYENVSNYTYNISTDERNLPEKDLIKSVETLRTSFMKVINTRPDSVEYVVKGELSNLKAIKDTKANTTKKILLGKLGAYKALEYILKNVVSKSQDLDDALVGLAAYGYGIVKSGAGYYINPPFLKLIATKSGEAVIPIYFPPGQTVTLRGNQKGTIQIVDTVDFAGIQISLKLTVGDTNYDLLVSFRFAGSDQITIEITEAKHVD